MLNKSIVLLALVAVCYAVEDNLGVVTITPAKRSGVNDLLQSKFMVTFPVDHGGNFGDYIAGARTQSSTEKLYVRELVINEDVYPNEVTLTYSNSLTNTHGRVTSVRAVNVGRQRAYVQDVIVDDQGVEVKASINSNESIRLMVEIYTE